MLKKLFILVFLILFSVSIFSQSVAQQNLEPVFKTLEETKVIGYISLIDLKCNVIAQLWMKFMNNSYEIENVVNPEVYYGVSIVHGNAEEEVFFHLVCLEVSEIVNIPEGMTHLTIPEHEYAVFTHKGSIETLGETYGYIFGVWIENSEYELDDTYSFELYDERFKYGEPDSEFDVYIPIK